MLRRTLLLGLLATSHLALAQEQALEQVRRFVPTKKWAICIGANNYKEFGALKYAQRDAEEFSKLLISDFGFDPATVTLLKDGSEPEKVPNKANIFRILDEKLSDPRLSRGDLFIFYFTGHGVGTSNGDFLMPTDATKANQEKVGIPVAGLVRRIVDAGLKNVLFIADACRSGAASNFGSELRDLSRTANIALMLGCEPGRRSYEYARFRHGAFTHFLLKTLKDTETADDATGALWTSEVAKRVSEQVFEYTRPDYGQFAQRPQNLAQPPLDVLMKVEQRSSVDSQQAEEAFLARAKGLTEDHYAASLIAFAQGRFDVRDYEGAIRVLSIVEGLGKGTDASRYTYATALHLVDRDYESTRMFGQLAANAESPFFKHLAVASSPSRDIPAAERVAALDKVFDLDKSPEMTFLGWAARRRYGSSAGLRRFLNEAIGALPKGRLTKFLEAELLANKGFYDAARKAYSEAQAMSGELPPGFLVRLFHFSVVQHQGDAAEMDRLISDGKEQDGQPEFWILQEAQVAKDLMKHEEAFNIAREAFEYELSPDELLRAVKLCGVRCREVAPEVVKQAAKYPYAWAAWLAKTLAQGVAGQQDIIDAGLAAADNFRGDELTVLVEMLGSVNAMLREGYDAGSVSSETYMNLLGAYFMTLAEKRTQFGPYEDAWWLLMELGLNLNRNRQLAKQFHVYALPLIERKAATPDLVAIALVVGMNAGDDELVKRLMQPDVLAVADSVDGPLLYSLYLACRGDMAAAKAAMPKSSQGLSVVYHELLAAMNVWLGPNDAMAEAIPKLQASHLYTQGVVALMYADAGKWDIAEPLLRVAVTEPAWTFWYVQAAAGERLVKRYRETGRAREAEALVYDLTVAQMSNPLFDKLDYLTEPAVESFVGTSEAEIFALSDEALIDNGRGSFEVKADGTFTGTFKCEAWGVGTLDGTVDKQGFVKGTAKFRNATLQLATRLVPNSVRAKIRETQEVVQAFELLDGTGFRVVVGFTFPPVEGGSTRAAILNGKDRGALVAEPERELALR